MFTRSIDVKEKCSIMKLIANGTLVKTLGLEIQRFFFLESSSSFLDASEEFEISEVSSPWAVH